MKAFRGDLKLLIESHLLKGYNSLNEVDTSSIKAIISLLKLKRGLPKESVEKIFKGVVIEKIHYKHEIEEILGLSPVPEKDFSAFVEEGKVLCEKSLPCMEKRKQVKKEVPQIAAEQPKEIIHLEESIKHDSSIEEKVSEDGKVHSSKRYMRFNQKWSGKQQWKKNPLNQRDKLIFQNDDIDNAEDDDYTSSWLECLRHGIPWGGRGNGGRGIQRVTGETQDVLIPNITLTRGTKDLLENSILKLEFGKRYALLGSNGTGKTSLLRRIATGRLPGFPPHLRVQQVQQELDIQPDTELGNLLPLEFVLRFDFERTKLLAREEEILAALERQTDDDVSVSLQNELTDIYSKMDYEAESRAEALLLEVGFSTDSLNTTMSKLSHGWRMKVNLIGALFMDPDVLLLDEPTNHLDIYSIKHLIKFLTDESNFKGTMVIVTHNIEFINKVCTNLIFIRHQRLHYFPGTYNEYETMRDQMRINKSRKQENIDKEKQKLNKLKAMNQKDRFNSNKQKLVKMRKEKLKRIEAVGFGLKTGHRYRTQVDKSPSDFKEYLPRAIDLEPKIEEIRFPACSTFDAETKLVTFEEMELQVNDLKYKPVTMDITPKARIGIIGKNGSGKSTLIRALLEQTPKPKNYYHIVSGNIQTLSTLKIGHFFQDIVYVLEDESSPIEFMLNETIRLKENSQFSNIIEMDTEEKARKHLANFGITKKVATTKIKLLSGGQKCRVGFALIALSKPELLLLDEPTNHLDIQSIEGLIQAIKGYNGAVIVISHNEYFLKQVVDELWEFNKSKKTIMIHHKEHGENREAFVNRII